jgi:ABC-type multidrug transport system fused ATPase/permease subunit
MFSDVNPLLKSLKTQTGEESHLRRLVWVERIFTDRHHSPEQFEQALSGLRQSPMKFVARCERLSLVKMFSVHVVDVACSIAAALLAVRILQLFENKQPSVDPAWIVGQSLFLAAMVFALNILAASLHAQKIERETLVVFRVQTTLARWLNACIFQLSRTSRSRFSTADLVNLAQTDARHMAEFYAHAAVDFPVLFVSVAAIVAIMWTMVGPAAFVALAILLLQIPVSLFFSWLGQKLHKELMRRSDHRLSLVTEWVQAARLSRYFGWSQRFVADIGKAARRELRQDLKLKAHYSSSYGISTSWWMLVAIGVFAGFLWFKTEKSASQVFAAIWLSSILGQQLNPLPWFVKIFSEARVGAVRLQSVFNAELQAEEHAKRDFPLPEGWEEKLSAAQSFENVSFECDGVWVEWAGASTPALKDITLSLPACALTAIVGPVGCGKSTFLQTLMGEVTPSRGIVKVEADMISIGGVRERISWCVHTVAGLALLRRIQTFVPQEAFVAAATVRENVPLLYQDPAEPHTQSDAQVVRALELAQLNMDEFTFPEGLSTELGERGVNLSGGQKQRLSLARAVYAERPLVLLDDPLSAVDTETEGALVAALWEGEWAQHQTLVWATHRLAHLSLAKKIIVLDQGSVIEQGEWKTLSQRGTRLHTILDSLRSTERSDAERDDGGQQ